MTPGQLRPLPSLLGSYVLPLPKILSPLICVHMIKILLKTADSCAKPPYSNCLLLLEQRYSFTTHHCLFVMLSF